MSVSVIKRLEIDAGHRLLRHEGKCRNVHGHRYAFEVEAVADQLDQVGRVIDFSVIKEVVGGWLDDQLDHGFIVQQGDPVQVLLEELGQKLFVMADPPTAENLARLVLGQCQGPLAHQLAGVRVVRVICWETPTARAVAT